MIIGLLRVCKYELFDQLYTSLAITDVKYLLINYNKYCNHDEIKYLRIEEMEMTHSRRRNRERPK